MGLILNRVRDSHTLERARGMLEGTRVELLGQVPEDEEIAAHDAIGDPIFSLGQGNPVYREFGGILKYITRQQVRVN